MTREKENTKILIVNDNEDMRALMGKVLCREGYRVGMASSSSEALQMVRRNRYDIAIFKESIPKQGGLRILPEIREINPESTIIVIADFGDEKTPLEARRKGADLCLNEPLKLSVLKGIIKKILEKG